MSKFNGGRARLGAMLAMSVMMLIAAQPAFAATTKFGAKLAPGIDPSNSPVLCDHEIDGGSSTHPCTWILNQAYGGGALTAPKNGTINKVKLTAWTTGSFTLFFARKNGSGQFKVTRQGPKVNYSDGCAFDGCVPQTHNITPTAVQAGEYIAIRTAKGGPMRCDSGGSRTALFATPLVVGGPFTTPTDYSGCFMMVQVVYSN